MSKFFATCARGLEPVLAGELRALGAGGVAPGRGGVHFTGAQAALYQANLWLRTAIRVLKPITEFSVTSTEELYDAVRAIDWSNYLTSPAANRCSGPATTPAKKTNKPGETAVRRIIAVCASSRHRREGDKGDVAGTQIVSNKLSVSPRPLAAPWVALFFYCGFRLRLKMTERLVENAVGV